MGKQSGDGKAKKEKSKKKMVGPRDISQLMQKVENHADFDKLVDANKDGFTKEKSYREEYLEKASVAGLDLKKLPSFKNGPIRELYGALESGTFDKEIQWPKHKTIDFSKRKQKKTQDKDTDKS